VRHATACHATSGHHAYVLAMKHASCAGRYGSLSRVELFVAVNVELLAIVGGEAEAQSGRDNIKAERSAVTGPREDTSGDGWRSQATSRGVRGVTRGTQW
jgi:hypothetical protein